MLANGVIIVLQLIGFDDVFFEEEMAPEGGEEGGATPEGEGVPDDVSPEVPEA
jgi:hypothetical protein